MTPATEIVLNDVFPNWLTGNDGFFYRLTNAKAVPWKNTVTGDVLDLEYHGNRSGKKVIAPLLVQMIANNAISEANKTKLVNLAYLRFGTNWAKLWATLSFDYNPIENYDMSETEKSETYTDTHTPAKMQETASGESDVYGFNSSTSVPDAESEATRTTEALTNETTTHTPDSTKPRTLTRHGNIGVTTSQQMITAERDLWIWQYFESVFADVDKLLCTSVYGEEKSIIFDYSTYTLPIASADTLGGVKPVTKTSEMTQNVGVDGTGALFTFAPDDYVVDSGETDGWYYRKWQSGKMEEWKRTYVDVTSWTAWGSIYYAAMSALTFGVEFSTVTGGIVCNENQNLCMSSIRNLSTTQIQPTGFRAVSGDVGSNSYEFLIYVYGTWK